MEVIDEDEYAVLSYDGDQTMKLVWLDASASMDDDAFRGWLVRLADGGDIHPCPLRLIDARAFGHRRGPETGAWRDANIVPRYNKQAVRKFAFLLQPGKASDKRPAPEGPASFPTAYFDSVEGAEEWLAN